MQTARGEFKSLHSAEEAQYPLSYQAKGTVRRCQPRITYKSHVPTKPPSPPKKAAGITEQLSHLLDERAAQLDQLASLLDERASLLNERAFLNAVVPPGSQTEKFMIAALNGEKLYTQEDLDLRVSAAVLATRVKVRAEIFGASSGGGRLLTKYEFENKMRKEIQATRKRVLAAIARSKDMWGKDERENREVGWGWCQWAALLICLLILMICALPGFKS